MMHIKEQKEMEKKTVAYDLYVEQKFDDGNDFVNWLETERPADKLYRLEHTKQTKNALIAIILILCIIIFVLFLTLFGKMHQQTLSSNIDDNLKEMLVTIEQNKNERTLTLIDTHFDYSKSTLTNEAQKLLDANVVTLQKNPDIKVRMAGYTSGKGTNTSNQILSEKRANTVRDYLIQKGIYENRISIVGYGKTKSKKYEASPNNSHSKQAKANMRVIFEVVVK